MPGGYDLIVLSNFDPPVAGDVERTVEAWLVSGRNGATRVQIGGARGAASAPAADASTTLPDTAAGHAAADYRKAFASGDTAVMRGFLTTRMAPWQRRTDERRNQYREMFAENGAMTLIDVEAASESEIRMRVNGAQSGPLVITLRIEMAAPHRINGIQMLMDR